MIKRFTHKLTLDLKVSVDHTVLFVYFVSVVPVNYVNGSKLKPMYLCIDRKMADF